MVRRRRFPPLRDAPAFPDLIVVFRYALMSPEETEDHVMSQIPPRPEREGGSSLAKI